MSGLDIQSNRADRKYPLGVQLKRVCWAFGKLLFRLIPRPLYTPRRLLLRLFGARVAADVNISNTAAIYFPWNLSIGRWSSVGDGARIYNLGSVTIGEKATVSQGAHLCAGTHEFSDPATPLLTPPIEIGSQAWVCADAFVGPGVRVGEGAVVGARAVAVKDVEPWTVVAGNPAAIIKTRQLKQVD